MAEPNGRGGWDLTDADVAEIYAVNWGSVVPEEHRCDESCVCPVHGTALIYWPHGDDHACQDETCRYGHGMRAAQPTFECGCPYANQYTCPACGLTRITNHCPHDGVQNPCPGCGWVDPGKRTPLQFLGVKPTPPKEMP